MFERAEEIRADRSTHERRLEQLLPRLVAEFADAKPAEEILEPALDAILSEFDDSPVRSFVLTLAERRVRDCLRDPVCARSHRDRPGGFRSSPHRRRVADADAA